MFRTAQTETISLSRPVDVFALLHSGAALGMWLCGSALAQQCVRTWLTPYCSLKDLQKARRVRVPATC